METAWKRRGQLDLKVEEHIGGQGRAAGASQGKKWQQRRLGGAGGKVSCGRAGWLPRAEGLLGAAERNSVFKAGEKERAGL